MSFSPEVARAARNAGYLPIPEDAQEGARDHALALSDPDQIIDRLRMHIKLASGGVVLSDEEAVRFAEGESLDDILAVRLDQSGDIQIPHENSLPEVADEPRIKRAHRHSSSSAEFSVTKPRKPVEGQHTEAKDNTYGRETAFCVSCNRVCPITYRYTEQITGGAILDIGGPVKLGRALTETNKTTHCSVCGYRVYTQTERKADSAKRRQDKAEWMAIAVFAIMAVIIIVAMVLSTPSK